MRALQKGSTGFLPVLSISATGSCAADVYEPRQVCEEATVNGPLWVSQGSLVALTGRSGGKSVFHVCATLFRSGGGSWPVSRIQAGVVA